MTKSLQILADHRDALLLAEVGAWLHDMGKCADEMIISQAKDKPNGFEYEYKDYYSNLITDNYQLSILTEDLALKNLIKEGIPNNIKNKHKHWLVRTCLISSRQPIV